MEHVVFFTGADGAAHHRRTASLDEAVRFVEHLRNEQGVEDPRVFSLVEVPLAFKAVYRVEVPGMAPAEPVAAPVEPVAEAPVPEPVGYAPVAEQPVAPVVEAVEPAPQPAPEPVAEATPEPAPEPVLVAAEPFATEVFPAPAEPPSNGKGARGLGFFTR